MHIVSTETVFSSLWFDLVAKKVKGEHEPYYVVRTSDYVTIIAMTPANEVIFVKQFRPVLETVNLELPSGHVDKGETPESAARRELFEETGYQAGKLELLGELCTDVGRIENRLWAFWTNDILGVSQKNYLDSDSIQVRLVPFPEISELIQTGEFNHALDLSVLCLAVYKKGRVLNELSSKQS